MIIGHERIIKLLKDLAKKEKLAHGYIFYGSSMVGKRTVAQAFAHFLEAGVFEPKDALQDMTIIAPQDQGALSIDAVRGVRNILSQKPNTSPLRTVILDDCDRLTGEAQGALLKITEEPPASSLIILIVTDPTLLLQTIRSRFQTVHFGSVPEQKIEKWLIAEHNFAEKKAKEFAMRSFGAPGRALAWETNARFIGLQKSAADMMRLDAAKRKDLIKSLLESEDFRFADFVDALISAQALAYTLHGKRNFNFWHRMLELRQRLERTNLNPRLQIEYLFSLL